MTQRYAIISAETLEELIQRVNVALDLGHELVGGINFDKINRPYQACTYKIQEPRAALLVNKSKRKGEAND